MVIKSSRKTEILLTQNESEKLYIYFFMGIEYILKFQNQIFSLETNFFFNKWTNNFLKDALHCMYFFK
jgi:hypothetical protein